MTSTNPTEEKGNREFDYLCVDEFISNIYSARALATAFEIGLIDSLIQQKSASFHSLTEQDSLESRGMRLLIDLLITNLIIENCDGTLKLSEAFLHALEFRDLLELKIALANFAAHDLLDHFSDFVRRPDRFLGKVKFCRLFSYDRCFNYSKENEESTKRWMRITTTLTKYEAHACMKYHDFGEYRRILDVGGNSGEFALQICRRYPGAVATVFDLPLVCDIGRQHIQSEPEANRISFIKGNALTDVLPGGFDLITFKSMLHDWPKREADQLITNASKSLAPGGTLLIFERGPIEEGETELSYSAIPILLFFHSFRSPTIYQEQLRELGLQGITVKRVYLETPFFIITAKKKD
jgi:SAM-dependent methyltransferase